jgi:ABC-type glutathione transport system ATPase component
MQGKQVNELSGGWRMRLAIARAMLEKADILYASSSWGVGNVVISNALLRSAGYWTSLRISM